MSKPQGVVIVWKTIGASNGIGVGFLPFRHFGVPLGRKNPSILPAVFE
jgi:hypothetical protein